MASSSSKGKPSAAGDFPAGESSPANLCVFREGERAFVIHGLRVYGAKVEKAEFRRTEWKYFIHYLGWNRKWDEWVTVDRLMKYTKENIRKKQALDKKQGVGKTFESRHSTIRTKPKVSTEPKVDKEDSKSNEAKGKKRKRDSGIEKGHISAGKLIKIQIPSSLKKQLVDDREFIVQQDKLVELPRSPNVDDILEKYLEYRTTKDGTADAVEAIVNGLRYYFNEALPVILLYSKERQQYSETVVDDVSPASIYGAEHLLRLFVKLPEVMSRIRIEEEMLVEIRQNLLDILKYLQKNQQTFFLDAYGGL